nr:MAG TPA: hypothetical protein [Caudoviricetes sp.]
MRAETCRIESSPSFPMLWSCFGGAFFVAIHLVKNC